MEFVYIGLLIIIALGIILWMQKMSKQREVAQKIEIDILKQENTDLKNAQLKYIENIAELRAGLNAKEELLVKQQAELINTREE